MKGTKAVHADYSLTITDEVPLNMPEVHNLRIVRNTGSHSHTLPAGKDGNPPYTGIPAESLPAYRLSATSGEMGVVGTPPTITPSPVTGPGDIMVQSDGASVGQSRYNWRVNDDDSTPTKADKDFLIIITRVTLSNISASRTTLTRPLSGNQETVDIVFGDETDGQQPYSCLLYTSPSPRD